MVSFSPRVLELLSSRICHDLVSPVGAINNGVELYEELGDEAGKEALDLIGSSAEQASVRLQCFRMAYGAAGADSNVTFNDVKNIFAPYIAGSRTSLEWELDWEGEIPIGLPKVVLNFLLLASDCSMVSGTLRVQHLAEERAVQILVEDEKAAFRDGAVEALEGTTPPEDLDAKKVHAYVAGRLAENYEIKFEHMDATGGQLALKALY